MKRMMAALAVAVVAGLPITSGAVVVKPVPRLAPTCPSSEVATDQLRERFDGYHEHILWAWVDGEWNRLCRV